MTSLSSSLDSAAEDEAFSLVKAPEVEAALLFLSEEDLWKKEQPLRTNVDMRTSPIILSFLSFLIFVAFLIGMFAL
jgi:hypothetical protein